MRDRDDEVGRLMTLAQAFDEAVDEAERLQAVVFGVEFVLARHCGEAFARKCVDDLIEHVGLSPRPPEPPDGFAARRFLNGWRVPT